MRQHKTRKSLLAILLALLLVVEAGMEIPAAVIQQEDTRQILDAELPVEISENTFPDENLCRWVEENLDADRDLQLSYEERETVTELSLVHQQISFLTGLEYFPNLQKLNCSWNTLRPEELELLGNDVKVIWDHNTALSDEEEDATVVYGDGVYYYVSMVPEVVEQEVALDETNYPDEDFRIYVKEQYDLDDDGILSGDEISRITAVYVPQMEITSLKGVEYFRNLVFLNCENNQIAELDISSLIHLRGLYCKGNQLTEIDATDNLLLDQIECDETVLVHQKDAPVPTEEPQETAVPRQEEPGEEELQSEPIVQEEQLDVAEEEQVGAAAVKVGSVKITSLTNKTKGILKVSYSKASNATGYLIRVSTDPACKSNLRKFTTTWNSRKIARSYQDYTYYVRVRGYAVTADGKKIYGEYSPVKQITITNGIKKTTASATAIKLTAVKLVSKNVIQIRAWEPKEVISGDGKYYLFALHYNESSLPSSREPIKKITKTSKIAFKIPLTSKAGESRLAYKFAIGVKKTSGSGYQLVSEAANITNPGKHAAYTYKFPKAKTKKGLQVNESYIADAVKLGVKHTTYNMCLDDMIATASQQNSALGIAYNYDGTTYWFSRGIIESYDRTLNQYKAKGMLVSAIILLRYRSDLTYLIPSGARGRTSGYFALDTTTDAACKQLEAVFSFLAKRYASNKRIVNWIIGNEVNNYGVYNQTGSSSLSTNADIYAQAFKLAYMSIRSVYNKARLYISLDHLWNVLTSTGHASKAFLDAFGARMKGFGKFNIAYHPYPVPLTTPEFWKNYNGALSSSSSSKWITMGNISVLTKYVKANFGSGCRIILSEQGFTSKQGLTSVPETQAAAIAYAYYLAEFNSMIDAFILHRHVDHQVEVNQGLSLGLWTNKSGTQEVRSKRKYAWWTYKYMDTSKAVSRTKFALPIIGVTKWKQIVPGYKASRFK